MTAAEPFVSSTFAHLQSHQTSFANWSLTRTSWRMKAHGLELSDFGLGGAS